MSLLCDMSTVKNMPSGHIKVKKGVYYSIGKCQKLNGYGGSASL